MKKEYNLNPDPVFFKEIYFQNNQGSYLISSTIKRTFMYLIFSVTITILLSFIFIKYFENPLNNSFPVYKTAVIVLLIVLQFLSIILLISYIKKANDIRTWKKQVNDFLVELEKIDVYKLILTDRALTIIKNEYKTIEQWSNFERIEIKKEYIGIENTNGNYLLIPSKSLSPEKFREFSEIIENKLEIFF